MKNQSIYNAFERMWQHIINKQTDTLDAAKDYTDKVLSDVALTETDPTVPEWAKEPVKPSYTAEEIGAVSNETFETAITGLETDYNESIIALSVDGTTVTYVKGDGSTHTFETQDTDTTYSLGTDEVTGLTKLYATTGNAEDGTMTQKAIKTELDKKVGVNIDNTTNTLIFTK